MEFARFSCPARSLVCPWGGTSRGSPLGILIWDVDRAPTRPGQQLHPPSISVSPLSPFHLLSSPFSNNSLSSPPPPLIRHVFCYGDPPPIDPPVSSSDYRWVIRDNPVPRRKPPNAPGVSRMILTSSRPQLLPASPKLHPQSQGFPERAQLCDTSRKFGNQGKKKAPTASRSRDSPARQREDQRRTFTNLGTCSQKTLVPPCLIATAGQPKHPNRLLNIFSNQNIKKGIWILDTAGPFICQG